MKENMRYLVMECRSGYAIVLDENGNFLRVANLGYEIGQTVGNVVKERLEVTAADDDAHDSREISDMNAVQSISDRKTTTAFSQRRRMVRFLAAAACLCIMLIGTDQLLLAQYGTVRIQINPDVLVSVNRFQYVVGIEGINPDGKDLIEDYRYFGKKAIIVSEELTDRAKQMGYLSKGGNIVLTVKGPDGSWQTSTEETIVTELRHHCRGNVNVSATHEGEEEGAHHQEKNGNKKEHHSESEEPEEEIHHNRQEGNPQAETESSGIVEEDGQDTVRGYQSQENKHKKHGKQHE